MQGLQGVTQTDPRADGRGQTACRHEASASLICYQGSHPVNVDLRERNMEAEGRGALRLHFNHDMSHCECHARSLASQIDAPITQVVPAVV